MAEKSDIILGTARLGEYTLGREIWHGALTIAGLSLVVLILGALWDLWADRNGR